MPRRIEVEIVGDSRSLERAFARSSKSAAKFNRDMSGGAVAMTRRFSAMRASIVGAGVTLALRDVVQVAAESQQVLGQTSVAVESAGLSWAQYSDQIQEAIQAQSQFGFDDEALLRSFSLFVRGSGSVEEALRRNRIAMDIARARFISLEQAANIVNKAALGQAGALRRLGIDARKGASGVELLAQLERQFGGAAEAASDDAATALERLNVQVENAKEQLGTLALPVVTNLAIALGDVATAAGQAGDAIDKLRQGFQAETAGPGGAFFDFLTMGPGQVWDLVSNVPWKEAGKQAGREVGQGMQTAINEHLAQVNRRPDDTTVRRRGVTAAQRNTWWDAMIGRREDRVQDIRSLKGQLAELESIAQKIRARIAATSDPTRRLTLGDRLVGVLRQQRQIQQDIAEQTRAGVEAEKDRLASIKAANQALKDRADAIKSAVLERLQRKQTDILNRRALRDAQERLRIARLIGGPLGTRAAREGLQDVRMDMLRARLEAAPATLTAGGRFALGNIVTINIHGVTDPNQVANKVAEVLAKRGRRTSTSTRGVAAGTHGGHR